MKFKKNIGAILLMLSAVIINMGNASLAMVGTEDMPDSIKKLR